MATLIKPFGFTVPRVVVAVAAVVVLACVSSRLSEGEGRLPLRTVLKELHKAQDVTINSVDYDQYHTPIVGDTVAYFLRHRAINSNKALSSPSVISPQMIMTLQQSTCHTKKASGLEQYDYLIYINLSRPGHLSGKKVASYSYSYDRQKGVIMANSGEWCTVPSSFASWFQSLPVPPERQYRRQNGAVYTVP